MFSYALYDLEVTLTPFSTTDKDRAAVRALFKRSPHRTCKNALAKAGERLEDRLDKFPTLYLNKLRATHYILDISPLERISNFWLKHQNDPHYTITSNQFPLKKNKGVADFIDFLLECEPSNLHWELKPPHLIYPPFFTISVEELCELLEVPLEPYQETPLLIIPTNKMEELNEKYSYSTSAV